ncbi:CDP-alcohol phosphatidyltransferase family protein [Senegalia massiliensis]|uniref:CDP-alcohol phosphatidyltransferase family protein n=1 Tax=Senegalia massiliensis TaxID=1720316 RepID=UPI001362D0A8|nr:CDP-alcohol phosphatidyltransferase family protein [Senegalia massiliensis]
MKKYIPNILSILRIICSALLLFISDRIIFIFLYFIIGLTDILDGFIARKFNIESELGARLDSFADFVFYIILFFIFTRLYNQIMTVNYKMVLIGLLFVHLLNLLLTKLKYKKFVFVHTIANKTSGILVYFSPAIILFKQSNLIIWVIFLFIFIAALEELLITIISSEVNLNRKSVFCK